VLLLQDAEDAPPEGEWIPLESEVSPAHFWVQEIKKMQLSVSRSGLTSGVGDVTFGGRLDPANVLDCSAYQLWEQGKVGKRVLKEAAKAMEQLLGNIVRATGRETDIDMAHSDWPARKAAVDAEREFFMSDDWLPRTRTQSGASTTSLPEAAAGHGKTEPAVAAAHPVAQAPLPSPRHLRWLDDNGRPVRNMHADRSRRRIDLNDMVSVDAETIAEQVPLVGEKTAQAIVAYRQRKADAMIQRGEADHATACRPIQNFAEMLEKNGGPVRGGAGKATFESLMCFTTL
jgi:hypothetical protein